MAKGNTKWLLPKTGSVAAIALEGDMDSDYPDLNNVSVYIEGNCFRAGAITMFALSGCHLSSSVADADIVCFLGGEDVDPSFYGEQAISETYFNTARDYHEKTVFNEAVKLGKVIVGLCRGMQFIHVMNGGKLWQHVHGHAGSPHLIVDCITDEKILASSLHHQMCRQFAKCIPLAYAVNSSGKYRTHGIYESNPDHLDLEAAIYPETRAIGFQGHPELGGHEEYTKWCLHRIETFMADLESLDDKNYQLKESA